MIDFTFNNKLISDYFNGDDSYIPVSELVYLHEHPLISQSFLIELEKMINATTEVLIKKNMVGGIVDKFVACTMRLGAELPTINQQNAPNILNELREIYSLCNGLLN